MTEPTRKAIIDAYEALDELLKWANDHMTYFGDTSRRAQVELIRSALPPRPNPTMAELEWDDDEHYLAEALHPKYGKVAMRCIGLTREWIEIMYWDEDEVDYRTVGLAELEPTGKHYFRTDKD